MTSRIIQSLLCLSCTGISRPVNCKYVQTCSTEQACFMNLEDNNGVLSYSLGCIDTRMCGIPTSSTNVHPIGHHTSSIVNSQCCNHTSLCNSAFGGQQGYSADRGPVCYACSQQARLDACSQIAVCGRDEACYIEETLTSSGQQAYQTGCFSIHSCQREGLLAMSSPTIVGRNSADEDSGKYILDDVISQRACCQDDFCNAVLPSKTTKQPEFTPPPTATTKQPAFTPPPTATTKQPAFTPPPTATTKQPAFTPPPTATTKQPAFTPPPTVTTKPAFTPLPTATTKQPAFTPPPTATTKQPAFTPPPTATIKQPAFTPPPTATTKQPAFTPPPTASTTPPVCTTPAHIDTILLHGSWIPGAMYSSLTCYVSGDPVPSVTWLTHQTLNAGQFGNELVIFELSDNDIKNGTFRCQATNTCSRTQAQMDYKPSSP